MRIYLALLLMTLIGCSGTRPPPASPPAAPVAPPIADGWHASYTSTQIIDAPLAPLLKWITAGNEIVAAMEETDRIKKPVEVQVVSGVWPEPGSVRWLRFSDGHYAHERVLIQDLPRLFRYQVYNLTSAAGTHIAYARGQQVWRELPDGRSEISWTYEIRPNLALKRPFIKSFLDNDMKPFMDGALERMAATAERHFRDI